MRNPKSENFFFPAEWHRHEATWLSFPINTDTWENRFERIYPSYFELIKTISLSEKVRINANDESTIAIIQGLLDKYEIDSENVELYMHKTNDSWCRDHGPAFLINKNNEERLIIDWEYNAWGGKYPPYNDDNNIPKKIASALNLDYVSPGIVMEGGSVEFNGKGTVMTSKSCLLNKNRNPHLSQGQIEQNLMDFYGVEQVLWIEDGIVGDDTDGHIDDTVRFVSEDKVITMVESNSMDENHAVLAENLALLKKMRLTNGKQLNIVEIEMPKPVLDNGERLPASYANFCMTNKHVIVPTYRCKNDDKALSNLQSCFKDREVVGIDSTDIIWGLGSFHCLSQQEPSPNFS
jgi:agmatine deiminase